MAPPVAPTNDLLLGSLQDTIAGGHCLAFLGAGVSHDDYPLWSGLINALRERCSLRPEDLQGVDPLDIAEAAKNTNPSAYNQTLNELFDRRAQPRTARRYHMLDRIPFCGYLTLNFDSLLLDTLDLRRNVTVSDYPCLHPQHLRNSDHARTELFYLHGRLGPNRPAEDARIVLTRSEFEEAYDPFGGPLHAFLWSALESHDICFIGCRPVEDNFARVLDACERFSEREHGLRDSNRPRRYLLWDSDSKPPGRIEELGIHTVRFDRVDSSYAGLVEMLEFLAGKREPRLRQPGVERSLYTSGPEPEG